MDAMTTRDIAPAQGPAAAPALTPDAGRLIGAGQLLRAIGGQSYTDLLKGCC
jgi:hypothetical protein